MSLYAEINVLNFVLQCFYFSTLHPWISWSFIQMSLSSFCQRVEVEQLLFDQWLCLEVDRVL